MAKAKQEKQCEDKNCPKHGSLRTHGRVFRGTILEAKAAKTATVQWQRKYFLPKFERYERRFTRIHVHNPECIAAKKGDIVEITSCRKLAKTKSFVITQKVGLDYAFLAREELLQQAEAPHKEEKVEEKNNESN